MVVPKPPVTLESHCSVIHDNTLYAYSSNGFVSIPLERNGTWSKLTPGVPVSNAVCVTGGIDGNERQQALYVVGGSSKTSQKPGLQRYSFKEKAWKTIQPTGSEISNRTSHSAVYLKSISSILVYGGHAKDGSIVTSDTFILETNPPYRLISHSGENASPAASPVLLPWTDREAALIGGLTSPKGVHLWDSSQGWHETEITLKRELSRDAAFALVRSADGSKLLQTFDMSASPSTVTTTTLVSSTQNKVQSRKRKRDNYPTYDDTLAPTTKRQDYSLAQGDDGLVVILSDSGTDSLAIFNQTANSWVNSTKLFYGNKSEQEILGSATTTTTTTSEPTSTSTSIVTSSASSSGNSGGNDHIRTILGATLGSLVGVAVILMLILFFIKRKKDKMRWAGGVDKDRLSFQDQGVEPLTGSAYPMAQSPAPRAASSVDSLAIFSGKMGDEKAPRSAGAPPYYGQKSQLARPSPLNNMQFSGDTSDYSRDDKAIEAGEFVRPGDRTTDEGWGKYFQNNSTPSLVGMQSPDDSARGSKATLWPAGANALPPLTTSFLEQPKPLGKVKSGSPTTEFATSVRDGRQIAIPESQSARISIADSVSIHSDDPDEAYAARALSWLGRPPSSAYSRSFRTTAAPSTTDYDSARRNTHGSSVLIPNGEPLHPLPRNNVNSDMSWLNLNADR